MNRAIFHLYSAGMFGFIGNSWDLLVSVLTNVLLHMAQGLWETLLLMRNLNVKRKSYALFVADKKQNDLEFPTRRSTHAFGPLADRSFVLYQIA